MIRFLSVEFKYISINDSKFDFNIEIKFARQLFNKYAGFYCSWIVRNWGMGGGRIGIVFASQFYLYRVVQYYYYCIKVQSWAYVQYKRISMIGKVTCNTMQ
jgi:hypothetical protein